MKDYTVSISNTFQAESPEDAVRQMCAYLLDGGAWSGGYRVEWSDGAFPTPILTSVFIDADDLEIS